MQIVKSLCLFFVLVIFSPLAAATDCLYTPTNGLGATHCVSMSVDASWCVSQPDITATVVSVCPADNSYGTCTGVGVLWMYYIQADGYSPEMAASLASACTSTAGYIWTAGKSVFNLSVATSGTGSGTVKSDDGSINCGSACSRSYAGGTLVNLIATPASGSVFAGWGGACTGTGWCPVTMNTAKSVAATFNPVPFAVTATGVVDGIITDPIATVKTTIVFKPDDAGKTGSVFVTALVPRSFASLRLGASRSFKAMAEIAANPDALILVQRTASGWQQVVNGQLLPYASGVFGDQLAAQTILESTDTSTLQGSQFCLGYGTDASEMAAAGRMQLIATVAGANATNSNTRSCNVALPITNDQLFAYAEANYASVFPLPATSGQFLQYSYRLYPSSGNYLGIDTAAMVYLYGPVSGSVLKPVGSVESFRSVITTWEATLPR